MTPVQVSRMNNKHTHTDFLALLLPWSPSTVKLQSDDIRPRRQTTVDQIAFGLPRFAWGKGARLAPPLSLGLVQKLASMLC